MNTERKRLIRPVVILKVKKFLAEVATKIQKKEYFSVDKLARDNSLSGTTGSAMLKLGIIVHTDDEKRGHYQLGEGVDLTTDATAIQIIEYCRVAKFKQEGASTIKNAQITNGNRPPVNESYSDDAIDLLRRKGRKEPELAQILETVLNRVLKPEISIFDGANEDHQNRVLLASGIAPAIYSLCSGFSNKNDIEELNEKVVFATCDLLDKLKDFKTYL